MNDTTLIDATVELILSPNKSGAYLTKPDILKVAVMCDLNIILQERKRMLDDLFKAIKSKEELLTIYNVLVSFYTSKKGDYETIFQYFPATKASLEENYKKCTASIGRLEELKEEAGILELGSPTNL
jgi:hypothetical protein